MRTRTRTCRVRRGLDPARAWGGGRSSCCTEHRAVCAAILRRRPSNRPRSPRTKGWWSRRCKVSRSPTTSGAASTAPSTNVRPPRSPALPREPPAPAGRLCASKGLALSPLVGWRLDADDVLFLQRTHRHRSRWVQPRKAAGQPVSRVPGEAPPVRVRAGVRLLLPTRKPWSAIGS